MIEIRSGNINDIEGIVKVNIKVWKSAYSGIIKDETLNALGENIDQRIEHFKKEYIDIEENNKKVYQDVAVKDKQVVGFIKYGDYRNNEELTLANTAEVYAIYVDDDFQGNNIGQRLMSAVAKKMIEMNCYDQLVIWTLEENKARGFYERLGGVHKFSREITINNQKLKEVGYLYESLENLL